MYHVVCLFLLHGFNFGGWLLSHLEWVTRQWLLIWCYSWVMWQQQPVNPCSNFPTLLKQSARTILPTIPPLESATDQHRCCMENKAGHTLIKLLKTYLIKYVWSNTFLFDQTLFYLIKHFFLLSWRQSPSNLFGQASNLFDQTLFDQRNLISVGAA